MNHAGHDVFNPDPQAPAFAMTRHMLGSSPDATQADPETVANRFEELRAAFGLMEADHDAAQGTGHWKTVLAQTTGSASPLVTELRTYGRSSHRRSS
jgi:hypothetical protein